MNIEQLTEAYLASYLKAMEITGNPTLSVQTATSVLHLAITNQQNVFQKSMETASLMNLTRKGKKKDEGTIEEI